MTATRATESRVLATPSALTGRSIAPDLARGAMLLLIAVANAPWYLWASETRDLSAHPVDASALDRIVQSISLIAIDGRTYPMFAFLFGYGIWQLYSRQLAAGVDHRAARRILRKRHRWMLAFGLVHAGLLWMGDIVGAYGLAGLVLVWFFLDRRDVTLKAWAIVPTSLLALGAVAAALGGVIVSSLGPASVAGGFSLDLGSSIRQPDYLLSIGDRVLTWLIATPAQGLIGVIVPVAMLVALVAARHRVLEAPREHLPLLRRTAAIGIGLGWSVGAVTAAQNADLLGVPAELDWAFAGAQSVAGLFCGIGYVALFGLIAARMQRPQSSGRVAFALQAVGKRSLTFYLAQSLLFAPTMSAWGLGLGAQLSSWSITLVAIIAWLITVAIAVVLEQRGWRGPAEVLLRRLSYPRQRERAVSSAQPPQIRGEHPMGA